MSRTPSSATSAGSASLDVSLMNAQQQQQEPPDPQLQSSEVGSNTYKGEQHGRGETWTPMKDAVNSDPKRLSTAYMLKGHSGDVTSLAVNTHGGRGATLLASASEDSTVRIWDLSRSPHRSVRQISKVFDDEEVIGVDFQKSGRRHLFAITPTSLFAFDLRKTSAVLLKQALFRKQDFTQDEISELSASGVDPRYVAVADDAGEVSIINVSKPHLPITASWDHKMMCGGVAWHPRSAGLIASAGMLDRDIKLWSLADRKRLSKLVITSGAELDAEHNRLMAEIASGGAETSTQLLNPPFVQSVEFHALGRYFATGGGDGSCHIYSLFNDALRPIAGFTAHCAPVSTVHFSDWSACQSETTLVADAEPLAKPKPMSSRAQRGGMGKKQRRAKKNRSRATKAKSSFPVEEGVSIWTASSDCSIKLWHLRNMHQNGVAAPQPLTSCRCQFHIDHGVKVNSLVSVLSKTGARSLFVADLSPEIKVYPFR